MNAARPLLHVDHLVKRYYTRGFPRRRSVEPGKVTHSISIDRRLVSDPTPQPGPRIFAALRLELDSRNAPTGEARRGRRNARRDVEGVVTERGLVGHEVAIL